MGPVTLDPCRMIMLKLKMQVYIVPIYILNSIGYNYRNIHPDVFSAMMNLTRTWVDPGSLYNLHVSVGRFFVNIV